MPPPSTIMLTVPVGPTDVSTAGAATGTAADGAVGTAAVPEDEACETPGLASWSPGGALLIVTGVPIARSDAREPLNVSVLIEPSNS